MTQCLYNDDTFGAQTISIMDRLHSYFSDVHMWSSQGGGEPMPQFKFRALLLIAEIYEHVRLYVNNHEESLSNYFGKWTLKKCLEQVVAIEGLQKQLNEMHSDFELCDVQYELRESIMGVKHFPLGGEDIATLYEKGIDGFCKECDINNHPSIASSQLWNAVSSNDRNYKFGRLFRKAKESFVEFEKESNSPDPDDRAYNQARDENQLSNQIAYRAKKIDYSVNYAVQGDFDCLQYILHIQLEAENVSAETICRELDKALEILRNVYMAEAEDIYYIRTGDFADLKMIYDEKSINHLYTELPFRKYYEAKNDYIEYFFEEIEAELAKWRMNKGYVERKLSSEEYEDFLCEHIMDVENNMKGYDELWELRTHSGGLDAKVTPENFARMFYRREGVDSYFIELEWKLEELTRIREKNKEKTPSDIQEQATTPEQKAVDDFVEKILMLVSEVYNEWNDRYLVPAVHKPEVHIVIKKDELVQYIQDVRKNSFDVLLEMCYPKTSKSKQVFCQYVVSLQEQGYFGELSNKMLAQILAPIVGLSIGTVTNYLSRS